MHTTLCFEKKERDYYGLQLLGSLLILLAFLAYASFYIIQNYMANSFFMQGNKYKELYFLESQTTHSFYNINGMDFKRHQKQIQQLQQIAQKDGWTIHTLSLEELDKAPANSLLVALDMMSLSQDEINKLSKKVTNGAKLLFNFTAGFVDETQHFQQNNLVTTVTPLQLDKDNNFLKYAKNSTGYFSLRRLSPLASQHNTSTALQLDLYDPIPIFHTPKSLEADAYLTNWSQSNYTHITQNEELSKLQSGLLWHGYTAKGKWVYFNFPSYLLLTQTQPKFQQLFLSMLHFLNQPISLQIYPYIDTPNAVFVSEDTEYKFESLKQFSDTALEYKFPVTAFCVAQLAQAHPTLMHDVSHNPYLEIASHSYDHKQIVNEPDAIYKKEIFTSKEILEDLTNKDVKGFRPPREEIDQKMIEDLQEAGYTYILSKGDNRLAPLFYDNLVIIPRHGTDDYSYLINLDWDSTSILKEIEHQMNVVTDLNGIYTLSTHSHLINFGDNIKILKEFFQKMQNKKTKQHPLSGQALALRLLQRKNISFELETTPKKFIITLSNDNTNIVKNLHISLEVAPFYHLKSVKSEIIGIETNLKKNSAHNYLLTIKELLPKSQIVLFINYDQK